MHCRLLVDNQVEVSEYISSCGIRQDRKGRTSHLFSKKPVWYNLYMLYRIEEYDEQSVSKSCHYFSLVLMMVHIFLKYSRCA